MENKKINVLLPIKTSYIEKVGKNIDVFKRLVILNKYRSIPFLCFDLDRVWLKIKHLSIEFLILPFISARVWLTPYIMGQYLGDGF